MRAFDLAKLDTIVPVLTARQAGLVACRHCGEVWPHGPDRCLRCGSRLFSRYPNSMQRVWAWWFAGLIAYIPANLYPMLYTDVLASESASTIIGGVIELIHYKSYFVAAVVFFASVMIPISKFIAIAWIALTIRRPVSDKAHSLHLVYEVVEFIGRWSMIDVFVVAILSALVHLGAVADIHPGVAAICFAISVIFTMLSALSLDPRLIWDQTGDKNK